MKAVWSLCFASLLFAACSSSEFAGTAMSRIKKDDSSKHDGGDKGGDDSGPSSPGGGGELEDGEVTTGGGNDPGATGGTEATGENGETGETGENAAGGDLGEFDEDAIRTACGADTPLTKTEQVAFAKPAATCTWNTNGNVGKGKGVMSARSEQTHKLTLPQGAKLCRMEIKSTSATLKYDDALFLTVDGYVLLSSWGGFMSAFQKTGALVEWDWSKIVGKKYGNYAKPAVCFGTPSSCVVPASEKKGAFDVSFLEQDVVDLGLKIAKDGELEFMLATTGDDDSETDCTHTGMTFDVTLHYVQ